MLYDLSNQWRKYVGFHGGELLLATSAHTMGGKPCFHDFSYGEKKFAKEGHGPKPINTPLFLISGHINS